VSNELAVEYEYLRQEVAAIDKEIKELQEHQQVLLTTLESIKELKTLKDRPALVPIGGGVYANTIVGNTDVFLVEVGANIFIEMPIKKAERVISDRIDQITSMVVKLDEEANAYVNRMREIEEQLVKK